MSITCASLPIFRPLMRRISESAFMTKLSSAMSIRKGTRTATSSAAKKHSPNSSVDTTFSSIPSFVHVERPAPVVVEPSFERRPESKQAIREEVVVVEPTFVQLPTIHVEERHNSLTAQWAGFLEESDRRAQNGA